MLMLRRVLLFGTIAVFAGGAVVAPSLVSNAATSSTNELAKLNVWLGHWNGYTQRLETPFGHASSYSWTQDCAWMPNHSYMDCDFLLGRVDRGTGIRVNNLSMFTYSTAAKAFKHMGITRDYRPLYEQVQVNGNTWITPYTFVDNGKTYYFRDVYEFLSADRLSLRFYASADDEHWTLTSKAEATRAH